MLRASVMVAALPFLAIAPSASAESNLHGNNAVGAVAGTMGAGIEYQRQVSDRFVLRGGPNYFRFDFKGDTRQVTYDAKVEWASVGALVDWHPWRNSWHISAGASFGAAQAQVQGMASGPATIGSTTYAPAALGRVDGTIKNNQIAPYLGLGYNNTFSGESDWSFRANAGVLFAGKPDVRLTATGPAAATPGFQSDLRQEARDLARDARWLQYYPVVTLGVAYRF